jgi:hypothetical protein
MFCSVIYDVAYLQFNAIAALINISLLVKIKTKRLLMIIYQYEYLTFYVIPKIICYSKKLFNDYCTISFVHPSGHAIWAKRPEVDQHLTTCWVRVGPGVYQQCFIYCVCESSFKYKWLRRPTHI